MDSRPAGPPSRDFAHLEALYSQIEETAGLGVWEWETDTGRVTWSAGLYRLYGRSPELFQPTFEHYLQLVHSDDRRRVRAGIERAARERVPFSHDERVLLPDGTTRYLHTWGRPSRQPMGLVGVCQDNTAVEAARRQAASLELDLKARIEAKSAELAYKGALLAAQMETSLEGILVVDPAGRILAHNRRFSDLWGIPDEVLATGSDQRALDTAVQKLIEPEVFLGRVRWLYAHPAEKSFETLALRDGRVFERYSAPVRDGTRLLGRVWYFRDVTQRMRAERSTRAHADRLARSNADLEMYASAAAHDLSAPLRKISLFSDLLDRRCRDRLNEEERAMLARIKGNAGRLASQVRAVLDLARAGTEETEPAVVHLAAAVASACSDLEVAIRESGAKIVVGPLPAVRAHPELLERLFQNLLSNALKFRAPGQLPRVEVGSRAISGGAVEVYVQDNGIGFEPSRAREVFQPFRRLHPDDEYQGTGIGLSVCERIAQRYGWELAASAEPGRGARFTLTVRPSSVVGPSERSAGS